MMNLSDREFIATVSIFRELTSMQQVRLLPSLILATYPPGTILFKQGDDAHAAFIIQYGTVEMTKVEKKTGDQHQLCTIGPGDIFGEFSLISPGTRLSTATVVTEARIFELALHDFESIIDSDPRMGIILLRAIARRAVEPFRELSDLYVRAVQSFEE